MTPRKTPYSGMRARRLQTAKVPAISRVLADALHVCWLLEKEHGDLLGLPQEVYRPLRELGLLDQLGKRRYRVSPLGEAYLRETGLMKKGR